MEQAAAQAIIRFGLGASPGGGLPGGPKAALRADLAGPDPALADPGFAALPSGLTAVQALRADLAARKALRVAGQTPDKDNFHPQSRALYIADAQAQMNWAVGAPFIREAIRPYLTGKFTDMVLAAERHPAMLRYLANDVSVGPDSPAGERNGRGLNENLGRECMELHTVGLEAGYTQTDVTNMAKLLTGWSIAARGGEGDATGFQYRPRAHEPGPQTVLGRSFDDAGQALTWFSSYPTTYQRLASKLVTHFVADTPPPDAVARIAAVLTETGGDLGQAALALVDLDAAWVPGAKLKTPIEYMVSVLRAAPPLPGQAPVVYAGALNQMGQTLWGAPLPNGWSDQAADWDGSDAVMSRIDWAYTYSARFDQGASFPQPQDIAQAALGPLLRPATVTAMAHAGSRREALTLLFAAPEFQRR
jgi:uncharacterized protein (DUF1800 family)